MAKDPVRWAEAVEIKLDIPSDYERLIAESQAHYKTSVLQTEGGLIAYIRHEYTNYESLLIQVRKKWGNSRKSDRGKTKLESVYLSQLRSDAIAHLRNRINCQIWKEIKRLKFQSASRSPVQLQPSRLPQTAPQLAMAVAR